MVTSNGARANCLAAESPPNPAPIITTRGRRDAVSMEVMLRFCFIHLAFVNADDHIGIYEKRQIRGDLELRCGCSRGSHRHCHSLPFGEGAKECIAAGWQAAD